MLKDGRLLDLTYGGGPREDHRNIQDAFDDMDLDSESDKKFRLCANRPSSSVRFSSHLPEKFKSAICSETSLILKIGFVINLE